MNRDSTQDAAMTALLAKISPLPQKNPVDITPNFGEKRHSEAFALKPLHPGTLLPGIAFNLFEPTKSMAKGRDSRHFIQHIITADLKRPEFQGKTITTRFPPEPNGYLHIGHAKSICLNFGLALDFDGCCHLRFDDTNPAKEDPEFVAAIKDDVKWLGFSWGDHLYHASEYFPKLYEYAVELIKAGKAYVCDLSAEEVREYRGTLTEPGRPSPHRDRSVEENLDLFERMKNGEFEDGSRTLRAKIDMASGNINLRDPALYRIRKVPHHRTGDTWCIYPMYDWTHGISDALEGITHSVCTLEFENHRPLYDWFLEQLDLDCHPKQIEFSRLNLEFMVMSKRKLTHLVNSDMVEGWDDPRMPTIAGLRRRGYTSESLREFCKRIGVSKKEGWIEFKQLEDCIRTDLNTTTKRVLGVLNPLKVVIENYPEDKVEMVSGPFFPDEPEKMGYREIPFSRELYIEQEDFMEDPPKQFYRLSPGREVRLRRGYYITCTGVVKDDDGNVTEVRATYDPESLGGTADGRRVKGTLHWVSASHAVDAEVRLYDRLFSDPKPDSNKEKDWLELVNEDSLKIVTAKMEPWVKNLKPMERVQFERLGFFVVDKDSTTDAIRFNRIVTLRDSWAKLMKKKGG